ncbi:MAG: protein phosphatase domain protein [Gemmatimonadetes bacterium]|nr:protein phosphatase domain protein [Gemmatimonadota bacterium]
MSRLTEYWKKVSGAHDAVGPLAERGPSDTPSDDPRRRLESFGMSHLGKVRKGNEDHFVVASLQRSLEIRQTNFEQRELLDPLCGPKAYLFAVADGVGGQDGGKLASGMTIQTIVEYLSETVGSYHAVPAGQEHAFLDPLGHAVQRAQEKLLATFGLPQGGPSTTLTIVLLVWPQAFVVHVGDSRAYHLRDGHLKRLTRDQTMGAFLIDEYAMTEQEAERGGYNNVLSSAIGSPEMVPAVSELTLESGDVLLLCTDGLTKHVSEERIASVLAHGTNAEASCRELIALALADGGRDNVTVVVANTLTA